MASNPTRGGRGADILFAQMVLLHHRQTVQVVEILDRRSGMPLALVDWAHRVRGLEEPEIDRLVQWLHDWGAPEAITNHAGHPMQGIFIDVQLAALDALDGTDFSRQWVGRMIDHQEGGAAFVAKVLDQSPGPEVAELARSLAARLPQEAQELRALR